MGNSKTQILTDEPLCLELDGEYIINQERLDVSFFLPRFTEYESKLAHAQFPLVPLGDKRISTKVTDGTHYTPRYLGKEATPRVPFIMVTNVTEDGIDFTNTKYISIEEHSELIKRCKPEPGDILLRKVGVGPRIAKVVPEQAPEFSIFVSLALIKVNRDNVIPEYLEAFLNNPLGRMQTERLNKGIGQPDLHIESIKQVLVPLPPKECQQEMVNIMAESQTKRRQNLSRVSKLREDFNAFFLLELGLELNREPDKNIYISHIEERLDPYYYHPKFKRIIDSLRRGKFQLKRLKEVALFSKEQIDPQKEPDRLFKYIQIQNIDDSNHNISSYTSVEGKNTPGRAKMLIKEGDLLVPLLGGSLQSIVIVPHEFHNEVATNGFAVLKIPDDKLRYYIFCYLVTEFAQSQMGRQLTGAIMSSIAMSELENLLLPVPDPPTISKIVNKSKQAQVEIERLQKESEYIMIHAKEQVEKLILGNHDD